MADRGPSVCQTSYRLLCEALRGVLLGAVESGAEAVGSVQCRAVASLYDVLLNHPVDRRGHCRSCRRPGAVLGRRRRRCRVHTSAGYWLHHRDPDFLLTHLARELGLEPLPKITTRPSLSQTPVVSSPPFLPGGVPRTRRPDPDHGEAGKTTPTVRWSRRDPSGTGSPPAQPGSLLLTRGVA